MSDIREIKCCSTCGEKKELNCFRPKSNQCRDCINEKKRIYRNNNKDKIKQYYLDNKEKINECSKKYARDNPEWKAEYQNKYREENKEKLAQKAKVNYAENKEELKAKAKVYRENLTKEQRLEINAKNKLCSKKNRVKYRKTKRKYEKMRRDTDEVYRNYCLVKSAIHYSFKRIGHKKSSRTQDILGCTIQEFKEYIESKFEPWMNWDNQGNTQGNTKNKVLDVDVTWDLDHIIPVSSAKNKEEVIKLNHYTNFQPLCSYINRYVKRNKLK